MNLYDIIFNFGTTRNMSIAIQADSKIEAVAAAMSKLRKREAEAVEKITIIEDVNNQ